MILRKTKNEPQITTFEMFHKKPEWVTMFPKGVVQRKGPLSSTSHLASQGRCPDRQSSLAFSVRSLPTSLHCFSLLPLISVMLNLQQKTGKKILHPKTKSYTHSSSLREPGSGTLNLPSCLITGHLLLKPTRVRRLLTMGLHFRKKSGIWRAHGG